MKIETKYNKIVNVSEDGKIQVLEYVFQYPDGFKGAVGSDFYPVSEMEYKKQTKLSSIVDRLKDAVPMEDVPIKFYHTKGPSYTKWAKAIIEAGEEGDFMFDTSYNELWDYMRKELSLIESEAYIFDCVGGGRMFGKDFQGSHNPELSEIIRQYES